MGSFSFHWERVPTVVRRGSQRFHRAGPAGVYVQVPRDPGDDDDTRALGAAPASDQTKIAGVSRHFEICVAG